VLRRSEGFRTGSSSGSGLAGSSITSVPESGSGTAEVLGGGEATYTKRVPLCRLAHPLIKSARQHAEVQTFHFITFVILLPRPRIPERNDVPGLPFAVEQGFE
jgi:hypothetical protein